MIIKVFLCIFGILTIAIFGLPLTTVTLNIGNLFGMIYGIMLTIVGITIDNIISKLILIAMIIFLVPYCITLSRIIAEAKQGASNINTIIILGCRVKGDKPSLALLERCRAGAKYLQENSEAIAILSGGQGSDELISEAECMNIIMQDLGIDKSRLYTESKSTSTKENLLFSKQIIEQNNLDDSIAIVSSEYHLYRAKSLAKGCGYTNVYTIPAKTKWYCAPTFYTREIFGIWAKWLKIKE